MEKIMEGVMQRARHNNRHSAYDLQADLDNIKEALTTASYDVKGRAGEIFNHSLQNVRDASGDITDSVGEYISHKPFKSLGVAVLLGVVLGFTLRR